MTTIELNRQAFVDALSAVEPAVPKKSPKEILQNVKATFAPGQLVLMATDQELSVNYQISATCSAKGSVLIPSGRLRAILNEVTGSSVAMDVDAGKLTISAGFDEFVIPTADPLEFPEFPENVSPDSIILKGSALAKAIRRTIWATDPQSSRYALGGVKLLPSSNAVEFIATDSRRLAIYNVACEIDSPSKALPENIIIPAKSLDIVAKLAAANPEADVSIKIQPSAVTFVIGSQQVFTRLVEGRFPRHQSVTPDPVNARYREAILAGPWLSALRKVSITTNEESRGVDFQFSKGKLILTSQANDIGSSRVELPLEGSETDLTITLDPRFATDFLKAVPAETVVILHMTNSEEAVLLQVDGGAYQYVQMPLSRDR